MMKDYTFWFFKIMESKLRFLKNKAQIALEFLLVAGIAVLVLIGIIVVVSNLAGDQLDRDTFLQLDDLGRSIQQEIIRGSELTTGYNRDLFIPQNINGREYRIFIDNIYDNRSDLVIEFESRLFVYVLPRVETPDYLEGTKEYDLKWGVNTLVKSNGVLELK